MADAKLTSKGQITIPSEVRQRMKLRAGDTLKFEVQPDGKVVMRKRLSGMELCGILKRPGKKPVTVEEMNESIAKAASDSVMKGLER